MIIAKALDRQTLSFNTSTSNSVPFLSFGYEVYYNLNTENGEYDSRYFYSGFCPYSQISHTLTANVDSETYEAFKLDMGAHNFVFTVGEYCDANGNPINIAEIVAAFTQALGI